MNTRKLLELAAAQIGKDVQLDGLLKKVGRLKQNSGTDSSDVLGFDWTVYWDNSCYEYYAANTPLIGTTQPMPIMCPVGIEIFYDFKVDYKEAIKIFQSGNWGDNFVSITICKPLVYPQATEPYWYFISNLGVQVVIGADSGNIIQPK